MLVPLASSGGSVQHANFHHAMQLYHDRPHLINKKLCTATTLFYYNVLFNSSNKLTDVINYTSLTYETNKLQANSYFSKDTLKSLIFDLLSPYDKHVVIKETSPEEFKLKSSQNGVFVTVRVLLPSNPRCSNTVEVVIFNYDENYVQYLAASTNDKFLLVAPPFPYKFQLQHDVLQLIVDIEHADTSSGEWLADKLFPKILKWCEDCDVTEVRVQSLSLINVEQYCEVYKTLKEKYGKKMVEIWPENTDPLKFVYEDVAIATYLICLWQRWSETPGGNVKKPSFVDLGCGNGLLVYILSEEGYPGLGSDVRKRKIWDLYPKSTNLQVKTIIPSDSNLFPEADWIIGNHSDELTPWIPVIAARSSTKTNFFLLPCCCYNFDGSKYKRINTAISQYAEYLQYVESICNLCGFTTDIDKLRIPSTKRTCLVGRGPKLLGNDEVNVNINKLLGNTHVDKNNQWIQDYQAREVVERVRNCTQLDRNFVTSIIHKLVHTLLTIHPGDNVMLTKLKDGAHVDVENGGHSGDEAWNAGTCLDIVRLVQTLEQHELKQLKSECGGLQTLMRNHRYIFEVEKGRVKLRPPYLRSATTKYVGKPCWFRRNHPNGCLHSDITCAYSH